ncbi:MAG TPA: thiamine pyrophosphate-dependent dehydrogenase E1 component subunit alpha [Chloroflexota bacterium]|nr:thiamine pyrophosphate-dependent dehydrogenase E1 component subunit alpha [Chloroflexota bacterium]
MKSLIERPPVEGPDLRTIQTSSTSAPAASRVAQRPSSAPHRQLGLSDRSATDLYYAMLVSRLLSKQCLGLATQGAFDVAIPSDGHEAAQAASIWALRPRDKVFLFYRSLAAAYARGMTARELMLDHFRRADSPSSGGRNLPGHWAKRALALMTISGSVATQIPHAVGVALASKLRGEDDVTIVYFGDGAVSKGDFHEGVSYAAIHKLPVVVFCENNGLAITVPFRSQSPVPSVAARASGYGIPAEAVDGADALAVYAATCAALERARRGQGPTLVEARVARLGQHTNQVADSRPAEELAAERARDPLPRLAGYLRTQGLLDEAGESELQARAAAEVTDAVEFARAAAEPAPGTVLTEVVSNQ